MASGAKIDIPEPNTYNKSELQKVLLYALSKDNINMDISYDDKYFCNNKEELHNYLISFNIKKMLSVKEKEEIMKITKRLSLYAKNEYAMEFTMYQNIYEIIHDAQKISKFGCSPSVRKCLFLVNKDPKININIKPILTMAEAIKEEKKKIIIQDETMYFSCKRATPGNKIIVTFE